MKECCWFDSVARATGVARVYDEGDKSRGQIALRGQLLLRGSTTKVINHEGNWRCVFCYSFEKLAECIVFT
ncbi:MAG: hypothetical protein RLZZ71_598 [Bacteroidota bacterium]